jgi:uncharacterized protein DUF3592
MSTLSTTLAAITDHLFLQFVVGFALCALACGLILAGRLSIRRAAESEAWPAVDGVVIESTVAAKREGRQLYRPVVRYRYEVGGGRYEVGGGRYEGSRIQWAASAGYRKYTRARRILDSYRSGHAIKVHYDPKRPGIAVLKPGQAMRLRPTLVLAPTAAMYTFFIVSTVLVGHRCRAAGRTPSRL